MPLPDWASDTKCWPPKAFEQPHDEITRWSAWWVGDPNELSRVYGGGNTTAERSFQQQGSFARNGVVGTLQRWFWGAPPRARP